MIKIDWTKPVRHVRDHQPVRVLCTDADDKVGQPVVVLLPGIGLFRSLPEGDHLDRFENVPETTVKFLNVYSDDSVGALVRSITAAKAISFGKAQAQLQLTFENDKLVGVEIVK